MIRPIVTAINKLMILGVPEEKITLKLLWENATEGIYNYYSDEQDFTNNFNISEIKKLNKKKCGYCGKVIVYSTRYLDKPLCRNCDSNHRKSYLPSCMPKDSKEYLNWYNVQQAACLNNMDHNSKEYQEWYAVTMNSLPQCKDENSEEYQEWYSSATNSNPACKDINSKEYQDWYNSNPSFKGTLSKEYQDWYSKQISALPQCKDENSKEYQEWYSKCPASSDPTSKEYQEWYATTMNSLPNLMDINSKEYKDWYNKCIKSLPNCMPKDSKEYKEWYNNYIAAVPSCMKHNSKGYLDWYSRYQEGMIHREWHVYSYDEQRLVNYNLPYVIRNEVGQEFLEYQSDDSSVHKFYPDFKIQIGYGVIPNTNWEYIEYKGDHLLNGLWNDQAQTHNKYMQCHDKVGFVPTSLSWLFELCILNPKASELWPNPRILAYAIYDIWGADTDYNDISKLLDNTLVRYNQHKVDGD